LEQTAGKRVNQEKQTRSRILVNWLTLIRGKMSYVTNRARPSEVLDSLRFSRSRSQSPTLADKYVDRISGISKFIPWDSLSILFLRSKLLMSV
jgi:hypothetical protein